MLKTAFRTALLALGVLFSCAFVFASEGPPPVLNPKTHTSPSGEWSLRVEPSEMQGCGEGGYRMTRGGVEAWSATLPYTLYDARVGDDGVVAGYAYSLGWRGWTRERSGERNGEMRVVILNADGTARLEFAEARDDAKAMHSPPTPTVRGLFVDPDSDTFVLRVQDDREPGEYGRITWWRFRTSTGERLPNMRPDVTREVNKVTRWEMGAEAIPDRALTATAWSRMEWRDNAARNGVTIIVLDNDGKEVARLDRPDEYATDEEASAARWQATTLRRGRAPGEFEFCLGAQRGWVRLAVEADGTAPAGWRIVECGPSAEPGLATPPAPTILEDVALAHLGTITLQTGAADASPIRNIRQFAFDGRGRIGLVSCAPDEVPSFVAVEQDGRVAVAVKLDTLGPSEGYPPCVAWVGGDKWIVVSSPFGPEATATTLRIDAATGGVEAVNIPDCPPATAVRGRSDGGFYVLGRRRTTHTMSDELVAFDASGRALWRVEEGHDEPGRIFAPQDIAVTPEGVAVLEGIRNCIQRYDADGKHLGTISLAAAWGRSPNYVTHLDADANGGFVLFDFGAPESALRLDATGKILSSFTPRFADGKVFVAHGGVRRSPSGDLWTTDGDSLLRLGPDGAVAGVAGRAPDSEEDPQLTAWAVGADGRIYALNQRTTSVLVFSPAGALERVCRPMPEDFDKEVGLPSVAVSPSGDLYMNTGGWNERSARGYLRFNADGTRAGFEPRRGDWLFRRDGSGRWEVGRERFALLDGAGAVTRRIAHAADGAWLVWITRASVAPDGSLALMSNGRDGYFPSAPTLSLYSPGGEPLASAPCPYDLSLFAFAFDGSTSVLANDKGVWVFEAATRAFRPVRLPEALAGLKWEGALLSPDSREAWVIRGEARALERFAMP